MIFDIKNIQFVNTFSPTRDIFFRCCCSDFVYIVIKAESISFPYIAAILFVHGRCKYLRFYFLFNKIKKKTDDNTKGQRGENKRDIKVNIFQENYYK